MVDFKDIARRVNPAASFKEPQANLESITQNFSDTDLLFTYYTLCEDIRKLLMEVDSLLTFGVFNKKGGAGKTPIAVLLALLMQFVVGSKPVLFGDANVSMATSHKRLSTPIDPNLISYADMVEALQTMRAKLNDPSVTLRPPSFSFTSYRDLDCVTHTTPQGLLFIPGAPGHFVNLADACAALQWAIREVFAAFHDSGNSQNGTFDEAAFRESNYRIFVCRGPNIESIDGVVTTMKMYSNRGYENAVRHAPVLVTEASPSRHSPEVIYVRLCAAAAPPPDRNVEQTEERKQQRIAMGIAEIARLGITQENYASKIFTIPFSKALSARDIDEMSSDRRHDHDMNELPRLSLNPTGGEGFSWSDEFEMVGIDVAIAAAKFLKELLKRGPLSDADQKADVARALVKNQEDISSRKGDPEIELDFYDPEEVTQRYLLNQKDKEREAATKQRDTTNKQPTTQKAAQLQSTAKNRRQQPQRTPSPDNPVT